MTRQQIEDRITYLRNLSRETSQRDGGNWNCFEYDKEACYLEELLWRMDKEETE